MSLFNFEDANFITKTLYHLMLALACLFVSKLETRELKFKSFLTNLQSAKNMLGHACLLV